MGFLQRIVITIKMCCDIMINIAGYIILFNRARHPKQDQTKNTNQKGVPIHAGVRGRMLEFKTKGFFKHQDNVYLVDFV